MTMKTQQEIFDIVSNHLLTQNEKAENGTDLCVYRSEDGLKCAIGCLIPDDEYDDNIEGISIGAFVCENLELDSKEKLVLLNNILKKEAIDVDEYFGLLKDLQNVHDFHDVEDWYWSLEKVADKYELQFNPQTQSAV